MTDKFLDGALVSLVTMTLWGAARLVFGRKAVAAWRWERRGFYRAYFFVLYYFSLVACGASIAYHEWLAAGIFGLFYFGMSKAEAGIRDGSAFRRAYVKEAGCGD